MQEEITELYIQLYGLVQGVNLRRNLSNYARLLGLKGYVKNLEDGSVEVLAQGKRAALEELLLWCQKGVFPAKVNGMNYEWREAKYPYQMFEIEKDKSFIKDEAQSLINLSKEIIKLKTEEQAPQHVVVIPDGNRRWAREKGLNPWMGHQHASSYDRLKALFEACKEMGVKYLTFWALSTENIDKRDQKELQMLYKILHDSLKKYSAEIKKEKIRFRHLGRKDRLPKEIMNLLNKLEEETAENQILSVQFCLDYGGRDDIVRAINKIIDSGVKKVDENSFSSFLDSKDIPDPDLIIRTSGEQRTSGILAYQATYAELYFTNVYFPDFDAEQFKRAVLEYSARVRRFGGTAQADLKLKKDKKPLEDIALN